MLLDHRSLVVLFILAATQFGCGSSAANAPTSDAGTSDAGDAEPDGPVAVSTVCDNAALLNGCSADSCTVSATGSPLPDGGTLTVSQVPAPADLAGDAIGSILCSITASQGIKSVAGLELVMTHASPSSSAVLFEYTSPALSRLVPASQPTGMAVEGLVTAPGQFGATNNPGMWASEGTGGASVPSSADQGSLLLNLSSKSMGGAFYDGKHLFVCNGPRLLIYNSLPANPSVAPDVVVGQPDLDTIEPQTSSSLFGGVGCQSVWSDGTKLAVVQFSRVLIWNTIPTANQTPADLVLGQPDFSSNVENNGGPSATSLYVPASVDSDGTQLVVADAYNNRALLWKTFPTLVDQAPDFVIGQPDFTTNTAGDGAVPLGTVYAATLAPNGLFVTGSQSPGVVHVPPVTANNPSSDYTALPLGLSLQPTPSIVLQPGRSALTPNGGFAVRDNTLARVDVMNSLPAGPATVDFVLGQPTPTYVVAGPVSGSTVQVAANNESGLGGGAMVLVPDGNRLLLYDTPPSFNFEPATRVVGQAGFSTNGSVDYRAISSSTLGGPADVAFANGNLAVADRGNNRVLVYSATGLANGAAASVVLGQANATSYVPNLDQQTPSASTLSGPSGVALDGTHLIVSDSENHRVLIWNSVPTMSGAPADLVLGQADFSGTRPNKGRGDSNGDGFSDADADGFFYPAGVASDGTHLFVADRANNRILVWNAFPTSNDQPADAVLGQADFTSVQANANGGGFVVVPNGFNLPTGVTLVGTSLWVADTENNRVVRWDNVTTTPTPAAFVGQPNGNTVTNPNYNYPGPAYVGFPNTPGSSTGTNSVERPRSVTVVGAALYVSETDSNRVHVFNSSTLSPQGELGQSTDTGSTANAGGVTASSLSAPLGMATDGTSLWVADAANNRVLGYPVTTPPATGAPAALVLGQLSFLTNSFNQSSAAAKGATSGPHGLSVANGQLYVADTSNNRLLVFKTPLTSGEAPTRVYGQPNGTLALPNAGGSPSASTLNGPQGVFCDGTNLIVADTANNRVLLYQATAAGIAATVVLGQSSFGTIAANAGGPSAGTMNGPTGVYYDGKSLWVADTGNNRVLVWKSLPSSNGQLADFVLGQTSFTAVAPNLGGAAATAGSLSFPAAILAAGGVVYIADSGNNRVVSYSTPPTSNGASANGVLGQSDLTSRIAATSPTDLTRLAGPVGLATDVENLYVDDRDLARVVVYRIGTIASSAPGALVIGQVGGLTLRGPGGVAVERTPYFTSRVYIADSGDNDVAIVGGVSRLAGP